MTERDLLRTELVRQAADGTMTARQVADALALSVRQVRRLISAFRQKGPEGLVHGNRGKASAKRLAKEVREQVLQLLRTDYAHCSTAQARDDLARFQGIELSYSTLYRLRKQAGLASPRHRRVATRRTRRKSAGQEEPLHQSGDSSPA